MNWTIDSNFNKNSNNQHYLNGRIKFTNRTAQTCIAEVKLEADTNGRFQTTIYVKNIEAYAALEAFFPTADDTINTSLSVVKCSRHDLTLTLHTPNKQMIGTFLHKVATVQADVIELLEPISKELEIVFDSNLQSSITLSPAQQQLQQAVLKQDWRTAQKLVLDGEDLNTSLKNTFHYTTIVETIMSYDIDTIEKFFEFFENKEKNETAHLTCPTSGGFTLILDPVQIDGELEIDGELDIDGKQENRIPRAYDRINLLQWLRNKNSSPMTNLPVAFKAVKPYEDRCKTIVEFINTHMQRLQPAPAPLTWAHAQTQSEEEEQDDNITQSKSNTSQLKAKPGS